MRLCVCVMWGSLAAARQRKSDDIDVLECRRAAQTTRSDRRMMAIRGVHILLLVTSGSSARVARRRSREGKKKQAMNRNTYLLARCKEDYLTTAPYKLLHNSSNIVSLASIR